jgi:ribosome maturation factor RimP
MIIADVIRPLLARALTTTGLVVEEVTVSSAGARSVVRVLVDRDLGDVDVIDAPTEPLSLTEVAAATRLVNDALDESAVVGEQPYTLEVSSPGVGRPLTRARHFQRNVGRLLAVVTAEGDLLGRLTVATSVAATIEIPSTRTEPARAVTVPYAEIRSAAVQVEFSRPDETKDR